MLRWIDALYVSCVTDFTLPRSRLTEILIWILVVYRVYGLKAVGDSHGVPTFPLIQFSPLLSGTIPDCRTPCVARYVPVTLRYVVHTDFGCTFGYLGYKQAPPAGWIRLPRVLY